MSFWVELWQFLKTRKKWWLAPIIAAVVLLGSIVTLAETSALAPFLYTLF